MMTWICTTRLRILASVSTNPATENVDLTQVKGRSDTGGVAAARLGFAPRRPAGCAGLSHTIY